LTAHAKRCVGQPWDFSLGHKLRADTLRLTVPGIAFRGAEGRTRRGPRAANPHKSFGCSRRYGLMVSCLSQANSTESPPTGPRLPSPAIPRHGDAQHARSVRGADQGAPRKFARDAPPLIVTFFRQHARP
jgi:hypothetical protein